MSTPYVQQISTPPGGLYPQHPNHHPPQRSPSHPSYTLPAAPTYVPDDVITGFGNDASTYPRQRMHIHEQGLAAGCSGTGTLSNRVMSLDIGGIVSPGDISANSDLVWKLYQGDEERVKEREILKGNRAKLCEYIHDCTVLFPYMREKEVFTIHDCAKIKNEITLKMDTFIDILLTKGPQAIGVFHESLERHYPAVFDVLSRLFTNAGIKLPGSRNLKEEDPSHSPTNPNMPSRIWKRHLSSRRNQETIRKRLQDLSKHCALVQTERDELQTTLQSREKEINALISRIDRQDQQNNELIGMLENWRKTVNQQSHGSIQKLSDILTEKESIQAEYTKLAGELDLTESELMAARDRISKLLKHLETTDKQATVTTETLKEEIQKQVGEIQRLNRKIDRQKMENSSSRTDTSSTGKKIQELEQELAKANEERGFFQEQMEVTSRERKSAIKEKDEVLLQLANEKTKTRKLKEKVKELQSSMRNDVSSPSSVPLTPVTPDSFRIADPRNHTEDNTIFTSTEAVSDIEMGMAIVVRGISENSKALQDGLKVGDEIREVNRVKVTSDSCNKPLEFARQIMNSVSQTVVTLTVRRQAVPSLPYAGTPPIERSRGLHSDICLRKKVKRNRKISSQSAQLPRTSLFTQQSANSKFSSSASMSAKSHDTTSGDYSDSFSEQGESDDHPQEDSLDDDDTNLRMSQIESGIVGSPLNSKMFSWERDEHGTKRTVDGMEFGPGMDEKVPNNLPDILRRDEQSTKEAATAALSLSDSPRRQLRRGPHVIIKRYPKLSKSLDDIDVHLKNIKRQEQSVINFEQEGKRVRRVIVRHGQWGEEFRIFGGRGHGLFVQSDCSIRGLYTGDQILQIGEQSTMKLTYAEAMDMVSSFSALDSYGFMTVVENKQDYDRLPSSARDSFYVRAKHTHRKSRGDHGLEYVRGDVFHVIDTKPPDRNGYWQVEKINKRTGEVLATGHISMVLSPHEVLDGTASLPAKLHHGLPSTPCSLNSFTSVSDAYSNYVPLRQVTMEMPRPVVLLGACEGELRKGLVEQGMIQGSKFAFCLREPMEKLEGILQENVVETIVAEGGVVKSTVEHVTRAAKQGYHCVLCLRPRELVIPGVASLHPIVILLTPRRGFKTFKDSPAVREGGRRQLVDSDHIAAIKRKYETQITGEISLSIGMGFDDALHVVRETVAKQQRHLVWEVDN